MMIGRKSIIHTVAVLEHLHRYYVDYGT